MNIPPRSPLWGGAAVLQQTKGPNVKPRRLEEENKDERCGKQFPKKKRKKKDAK